jgi:predicted transcriptional regulator
MGATLLLSSRGEARTVLATRAAETVTVADVMLNEFMTISASETLSDALRRTVHSLQDVFPVVRGSLVVGAISRETILQALRADGDGYLQSAMTRAVEVANPEDQLMSVLRRVQYSRGAQLLPVVKGDAVIGILTPSNLSHSMGLLGRTRRALDRNAETGGDA